jgi:nitrogen PTS system EIIA component
VKLDLTSESKDDVLKELIQLLGLDEKSEAILFKTLKRRENLGSTGIGKGIAIPHCRSLVASKLRLAYGRKPGGMDFAAIDDQPVHNFFLIVAPPLEVSNQYLPVLGKVAQFAKDPDIPEHPRGPLHAGGVPGAARGTRPLTPARRGEPGSESNRVQEKREEGVPAMGRPLFLSSSVTRGPPGAHLALRHQRSGTSSRPADPAVHA